MDKIGRYEFIEKIRETSGAIIYRALCGGEKFIIKLLKAQYPTAAEIARFKHEYAILESLDIPGIIRPVEIIDSSEGIAIVEEDFQGISLKDMLRNGPFEIGTFLKIGIEVSRALGELHLKNIIHNDIKPANILINHERGIVKITDFGISAILTKQNEELFNPAVVAGTLVYMSPEQTGRMNRTIDYRTDLYSLGVTFFELITGNLPFTSTDPMEIMHSHIARRPPLVINVNGKIPVVLSRIIDRLLSKIAEERYQNAFGVMADLNRCYASWNTYGSVTDFEIGLEDVSLKFNIPSLLVGREGELTLILDAYENSRKKSRNIIMVTGAPGIGKSALIHELHKPITSRSGYLISGKYDQLKRDVPYSAVVQAFQHLVRQILSEDQTKINRWKDLIKVAIGVNAGIITSVIPEIELLIGRHALPEELGPEESRNRFMYTFKQFIGVFCTEDHPVTMFLDDLQWIDIASLNLFESIVTDTAMDSLFILGAYRDREIGESHPLWKTFEELQLKGVHVTTLNLAPLTNNDIQVLISHFMKATKTAIAQLSKLVFEKTGGNPFFVNHFLKALFDNGKLVYTPGTGWKWDINEISTMDITDNVVDLMVRKIRSLPAMQADMLKMCACIGNRFDLEMLSQASGKNLNEVLTILNPLIENGFIALHTNMYRFLHDRIQEAAYSLVSATQRIAMHYRIGMLTLDNATDENLADKIFYITHHLNLGSEYIEIDAERTRLAELNLMAGKKAKESSAFATALQYFKNGLGCLRQDSWKKQYTLTFQLHTNCAECEGLSGNPADAKKMFEMILANTRSDIDRGNVYIVRNLLLASMGEYEEALRVGLQGLKRLGIPLSVYPSLLRMGREVMKMKWLLRKIGIDGIPNLKPIDSERVNMIAVMIKSLEAPAFYLSRNLNSLLAMIAMNLIIKNGLHPMAHYTTTIMAAIYGSGLGDWASGKKFFDCSALLLKTKKTSFECGTIFLTAYLVWHWWKPAAEAVPHYKRCHINFIDRGDFPFASHSANNTMDYPYMIGTNIDEAFKEYLGYESFLKTLKDPFFTVYFNDHVRFYKAFKGATDSPVSLNINDSYTEKRLKQFKEPKVNNLDRFYFTYRLILLNYLHGNYAAATALAHEIEPIQETMIGTLLLAEYIFYYALSMAAAPKEASAHAKKNIPKKLISFLKKLKIWAGNCPENFLHKYELIAAEVARLSGNDRETSEHYMAAVQSARENGYINNEAIAEELQGTWLLSRGDIENARKCLERSHYCYLRWGATAKADALKKKHADLIGQEHLNGHDHVSTAGMNTNTFTRSTETGSTSSFDLTSTIKASQIISGEIVLPRLLDKLMKILIENAGAEYGVLILNTEGELTIEAQGSVGTRDISVMQALPLAECGDVSHAIIQYAFRTGERVIIHDAQADPMYANDPHVKKDKVRSVLCIPIINQGKTPAILYLENNLTINAFTRDRIELLGVLSSQAAVSIDNARLYANLEKKVEERTFELKKTRDALWGEMMLASKIQTVLLPHEPAIPGYEILGYMKPADEVGGDYYDVITGSEASWIFIGDVSGHGVPAGLVMMMVQTSMQILVREYPNMSPSKLLEIVNKGIVYNIKKLGEDKYMTITALKFLADGHVIHSGLHQDLLVYRAASGKVESMETGGQWLGFEFQLGSPNRDIEFFLAPGDVLLLYSDGITEAIKADVGMFESDNLINILEKKGPATPREIRDGILDALEGYKIKDDQTMLIVKKCH